MRKILSVITGILITIITSAQTNVYPYSDTTVKGLLENTVWIRSSAENLLKNTHGNLDAQDKLNLCVILDNYKQGLQILKDSAQSLTSSNHYFKMWDAMYHSYFTTVSGEKTSTYYSEIKQYLPGLNMSSFEKGILADLNVSMLLTSESSVLEQIYYFRNPEKLNREKKELTREELISIIDLASIRKMFSKINEDQNRLASELKKELTRAFEAGMRRWNETQYHYIETDYPVTVIAANLQCFDKSEFPENQIWKNPKEIPDNDIDDDGNGIVDDIHGIISNGNDHNKMAPIYLDREKDIEFFPTRAINHNHGNMTVELMIKDNPTAVIMGLEHNQYDSVWKRMHAQFTDNISANRKMVEEEIAERMRVWKGIVDYLNKQKVKVAEINSMGFLLDGDEFVLTGCGKDEEDTKKFTEEKFWQLVKSFTDLFATAPGTLFVIGAGNDYINTADNPNLNNQIHLPNTLIAGALYKDMRRVDYSDYGKDVEIYAPAHFPLKTKFSYPESSGTSAASPVVCNLAIKLFSLNPDLTPAQVKQLIVDNSDKDLYETGINIINPKNTVEAMKKIK